MQTGVDFTAINRNFCVKDGMTELHHPHQNPPENQAARWLKFHTQAVMNITGAPDYVWSDCILWVSSVHNIVADESLNYNSRYEIRHHTTHQIFLPIFYSFLEENSLFQSRTVIPQL